MKGCGAGSTAVQGQAYRKMLLVLDTDHRPRASASSRQSASSWGSENEIDRSRQAGSAYAAGEKAAKLLLNELALDGKPPSRENSEKAFNALA
jgi:hypothetical protein